jgi:hypothetical protein
MIYKTLSFHNVSTSCSGVVEGSKFQRYEAISNELIVSAQFFSISCSNVEVSFILYHVSLLKDTT